MEDLRALSAGVCDKEEREKCRVQFGENLDWACANCNKRKEKDLSDYTQKLLRIRTMRIAGYPLKANDLTFEEWMDLGLIEEWLSS